MLPEKQASQAHREALEDLFGGPASAFRADATKVWRVFEFGSAFRHWPQKNVDSADHPSTGKRQFHGE
jgi:hypothetical protein